MSDYEATRQANIERNKALLQSLGLDKPFFEPKETSKKASPKKRRLEDGPDQNGANKVQRKNDSEQLSSSGLRRSQRNVGKMVKYSAERVDLGPVPASVQSGLRSIENEGPLGRPAGSKRIHNPYAAVKSNDDDVSDSENRKQFGSIPGIKVGTWWETRFVLFKPSRPFGG
jgi:E3 ubiquitin-protein ligase UHRF1